MNTDAPSPSAIDCAARDARFDAAMRARHAEALTQLTPRLRWQLRPEAGRSRARAPAAPRAHGWRVGAAFAGALATLCAVAVGLGLRDAPAPDDAPPAQLATAATQDTGTGVLEQDPDFYAWLASDDADLVAME